MSAARPSPVSPVVDDDATLVARAAAGDERAFTAIYRRYARYVAGVALRLTGDESEVDDVVQETFVDAAEGLASLQEGAALRRWLVTIAARKVARRIARKQRQRWLSSWLGRTEPRVAAPAVEGEAFALYQALAEVSPERRVPWSLHVIEGLTLPEVAETCGISLATAKRRIQEATQLLTRRGQATGTGESDRGRRG